MFFFEKKAEPALREPKKIFGLRPWPVCMEAMAGE
jgi:hypothetical protein